MGTGFFVCMGYITIFIDDSKPLCKPKIVAVEEDWELLCRVYPEPGFRSYFPGFIISTLAKQLRQNGIKSYFDRVARPEFAELANLLSNIQLVQAGTNGKTPVGNVGGGTGGTNQESPSSAREPARVEDSAPQGSAGEGSQAEEVEGARPKSAWNLTAQQASQVTDLIGYGFKQESFDPNGNLVMIGSLSSHRVVVMRNGLIWSL